MRLVRIDQQRRIIHSFCGAVRALVPQWSGHQSITVHGSSLRGEAQVVIEKTQRHKAVFRGKSVDDTIRDFRKSGEFTVGRQRTGTAETP